MLALEKCPGAGGDKKSILVFLAVLDECHSQLGTPSCPFYRQGEEGCEDLSHSAKALKPKSRDSDRGVSLSHV